jgi:uncharacterized protein (DUF362 family)
MVCSDAYEGPGHQRDAVPVLAEGGLEAELRERRIRFVDLNRDEILKVPLQTSFTGLDCLWLPRVLTSEFIVSMPKVKTHHWAGVTLSMKNLFGVAPGAAYGWPKNLLHWNFIDRSILDINAAVPAQFVIADGIIGMEGNGPMHSSPRNLGRIVFLDVARLYMLALEKQEAGSRYHAVAEEGVPVRAIAEVIGRGLKAPVVAMSPDEAAAHFGWLAMFAGLDLPASSAQTQERLQWRPTGPGLITDLEQMHWLDA